MYSTSFKHRYISLPYKDSAEEKTRLAVRAKPTAAGVLILWGINDLLLQAGHKRSRGHAIPILHKLHKEQDSVSICSASDCRLPVSAKRSFLQKSLRVRPSCFITRSGNDLKVFFGSHAEWYNATATRISAALCRRRLQVLCRCQSRVKCGIKVTGKRGWEPGYISWNRADRGREPRVERKQISDVARFRHCARQAGQLLQSSLVFGLNLFLSPPFCSSVLKPYLQKQTRGI